MTIKIVDHSKRPVLQGNVSFAFKNGWTVSISHLDDNMAEIMAWSKDNQVGPEILDADEVAQFINKTANLRDT